MRDSNNKVNRAGAVQPMGNALILDLDGTLLNTLEDIHIVVNSVFRTNDLPSKSISEVKAAVGSGVEELVRRLLRGEEKNPQSIDIIAEEIRTTYLNHDPVHTQPYPGVEETLNRLALQGIPMAVLTNKPQLSAEKTIDTFFRDIPFTVVRGVLPGCPMKPSADAVMPVIGKLGTEPQETYMVGDSDVDMLTAKNAGMIAVGVSWGFRDTALLLRTGAHLIVNHPGELLQLFKHRLRDSQENL